MLAPMDGSPGPRLRLILRQPDGGFLVAGPEADRVVEVEFVGYSDHGRLSGRIGLDGARITDMLNDHDELEMQGVRIDRLPGGESRVLAGLVVRRDELILVRAAGPRGDRARRTRTVARAVTVRAGPYVVTGDVHTAPGLDPLQYFRRRRPMVPLTDAVVEYRGPRGPVREYADTIVVNRDRADWVRRTTDRTEPTSPYHRMSDHPRP